MHINESYISTRDRGIPKNLYACPFQILRVASFKYQMLATIARSNLLDPVDTLSTHGITSADPVDAFWNFFMQGMGEQHSQAVQEITRSMKDEWGVITVGCLRNPELWLHEVEALVKTAGGKGGWVKSIQRLLNFKYRELSPSLPESAGLVNEGTEDRVKEEKYKRKHKLGAYLRVQGLLGSCVVPQEQIAAAIVETADPKSTRLTYNDSKRVAEVVFLYIIVKYRSVGGCKELFEHLDRQLSDMGVAPHKGKWHQVLRRRFQSGRRSSAAVRCALSAPTCAPRLCSQRVVVCWAGRLQEPQDQPCRRGCRQGAHRRRPLSAGRRSCHTYRARL